MNHDAVILVTGAKGMVGGAVTELLLSRGFTRLLAPKRSELDLEDGRQVDDYFRNHRPQYVLMCAAKVGGIAANMAQPVEFLVENLRIQTNLFAACYKYQTQKNLFLGSSCIYPRSCSQPMKEESLLTGPLEPTNEGYALSKITGIRLAQAYWKQYGMRTISAMPCNVYGTRDNFDLDRCHVLSALVRRFVDAEYDGVSTVTLWGTGCARREFIHVDDLAEALLLLIRNYNEREIINVGTGYDVSIRELAEKVATAVQFGGKMQWDSSKPDGMPRKCVDITRLRKLGFEARVSLDEGIGRMVREYRDLKAEGRVFQCRQN